MKERSSILIVWFLCFLTFCILATSIRGEQTEYPKRLTDHPALDTAPSWHPDGTKMTYGVTYAGGDSGIWVMNSDGSNKIQLINGPYDQEPDYSPDGSKIAFMRYGFRGDVFDLMVMNSDGTNVQRITLDDIPGYPHGGYGAPEWSRDGSKILFHYNYPSTGTSDIFIMNADGSNIQRLGLGSHPHWAFDDAKIIFDMHRNLPYRGIYIMNSDGTNLEQITDGTSDGGPDSSSSGRVVFSRLIDGKGQLFVVNLDGSGLFQLTEGGTGVGAGNPCWSPNGKYIAFEWEVSGNRDIWVTILPTVLATVGINPDTLNLRSKGEWITAYIDLPEGYDVNDINVSSILLNSSIPVDLEAPIAIGDYDNDTVPDLMVKFDRSQVISYILNNIDIIELIEERFMDLSLTISGKLYDGTPFQGSDTIKIILPMPRRCGGCRAFPI